MKNQFTYFQNCNNLSDVKSTFRNLAKKNHPDLGGNQEIFKIINNEYEIAFEYFQKLDNENQKAENIKNNKKENYNFNYENSSIYKNIIEKLIHYKNVNIEVVGSWIWLDGETYPIKDIIKELHFRWSKSKKKWYYFENIENSNKRRGFYSYDKIVEKYGATKIENEPYKRL